MAGDKPENPQVYPSPVAIAPNGQILPVRDGITLRDYAAIKAMAAQIATVTAEELATMKMSMSKVRDVIATSSYDYADAMLKAREK